MNFITTLAGLALLAATGLAGVASPADPPPPWVTAYYPVWHQRDGSFPPDRIDFSAVTHLVHFSIVPRKDGTIEDTQHGTLNAITPAESQAVVTRAHRDRVKVLVCLGGAGSGPVMEPALAAPVRGTFITNLLAFVAARGYDGIDLDMEPITASDEGDFIQFVRELRARMKAADPRWLLTIPASGEPGDQPRLCALLKNDFDQINIQTYDLSGTWDGFKTWYNGSLYGDGSTLMTGTRPYPSADEKVGLYVAAGVPRARLGIGIAFYGYVWSGADGPAQATQGVSADTAAYSDIMDKYYQPDRYHWDADAHAPYLSIGGRAAGGKKFVSYDDARLAREKVLYARTHGLGGVIIWELGDGYRAGQPAGRRDVLLKAVAEAARGPIHAATRK